MSTRTEIAFWGVRGSLPACGPHTRRYGGNSICLAIHHGKQLIICDAGSGIRALGAELMKMARPIKATILLSHLHWDHFMGLPFFDPLYEKANTFIIAGMGYNGKSFKAALSGVMGPPYFPVTPRAFTANTTYKTLSGRGFHIGRVAVKTFSCHHPGGSFGWKFIFPGGTTLVHISDNEPSLRNRDQLLAWMEGADCIIHDAQYAPAEYPAHRGWGHSPFTYPVEMAIAARAKQLMLYHFDPASSDEELESRLRQSRGLVRRYRSHLRVDLAREGMSMTL